MREAYRRSQEYLSTIKIEETSEERIREAFKKQLLIVAGFMQVEIDGNDQAAITDEEFQTMVRQRLLGAMANNGARQKVVGVNEVERFITEGWDFVAALPNDRAIMKIPC